MLRKIFVAPSILSGDFAEMGKSARLIKEWGGDFVHCDVMDGRYVNNITFGMPMVAALRKVTDLCLDVHLMIVEPEKYVVRFADSGADIITFHPDATEKPEETLKLIKSKGKKCGLVFNPDVPIEKYAYLFSLCDIITVMTVYAGKGGQELIPRCVERIKTVREILDKTCKGMEILLEADGGINVDNVSEIINAGANVIVSGSGVFSAGDPAEAIKIMKGNSLK